VAADQTDFLVVGVLGLQHAGKSTLLSHLHHGISMPLCHPFNDSPDPSIFHRAPDGCGAHETVGIDFAVTRERVILLDSQVGGSDDEDDDVFVVLGIFLYRTLTMSGTAERVCTCCHGPGQDTPATWGQVTRAASRAHITSGTFADSLAIPL
jgi:hypothetical protein